MNNLALSVKCLRYVPENDVDIVRSTVGHHQYFGKVPQLIKLEEQRHRAICKADHHQHRDSLDETAYRYEPDSIQSRTRCDLLHRKAMFLQRNHHSADRGL